MATFYSRLNNTLISDYIKGYWENVANHRVALQALMKRGHIETGKSGQNLVWDVRAGRYTSASYNELDTIDIVRKNHYAQANLPWAFLQVNDGISRDEIALASGEWALVRHEKEMVKNLCKDFETRINADFLSKNGATSTGNVLYGLPTIFQDSGSFVAANRNQTPAGTYAGLSLTSSVSVDNVDTNVWSPILVNYTSTSFNGGAAATWANQALTAITYAKDQVTYGTSQEDVPDLLIVDRTMFSQLKSLITSQQRMVITTAPGDAGPAGLGIINSVQHDGLEVMFDPDQPANTGFMLNFNQIWLELVPVPKTENPGPNLTGKGSGKPDYFEVLTQDDIRSNGVVCRVNLRGQFRFNPRYQAKLFNYA